MAIESECIVCRLRQALDVCNFVSADEDTKQAVLKRVMEILISGIEEEPQDGVGFLIHNELRKITNHRDPYQAVKKESIRKAIGLYSYLTELVNSSDDQLKTAVELCVAGNVIDFGPSNSHDIELAIKQALESEKTYFDFANFQTELGHAKTVLVLGDNAGETVFDRLLIERLGRIVFYAVKSEPILNDAIREDAIASGIGEFAEIIENGSPMGGTHLPSCSKEFRDLFDLADMVISKGQANFETLVDEPRRIFFLFKVKCSLLSRKHELPLGEFILFDNSRLHQ